MKFLFPLLLLICMTSCTGPDISEVERYKQLISIDDPVKRADGLELFIARFPVGEKSASARSKLVEARMESRDEKKIISAARNYLDSLSGSRRVSATVNLINHLAYRGLAFDTVLAWAQTIEPVADTTHRFYWGSARNARATVLLQRGKVEEAYSLQQSAVSRNPDESEFIRNLAVLEAKLGKSSDALRRIVPLAIDGDGEAMSHFLAWTESTADRTNPRRLRDSISVERAAYYIDSLHGDNKTLARSMAAVFLARCGNASAVTESWTLTPLNDPKVSAADEVAYRKNRGFYLAALGKDAEALAMFAPISELMDPWNPDEVLMYGRLLESATQRRDAMNAYATAMLVEESENIRSAYLSVYEKEFGSTNGSRAFLEQWRDSLENFRPPHRTPEESSKVVLAELFTGAECGPCLSADLAFDALSEYYSRNEVAILEYHLHIPRPDPMTNNDGWNRYQFYGGDFGTPTTIVDGIDMTFGGGPKFLKRNRFFFFDRMIQRYRSEKPPVELQVLSSIDGEMIEASAEIKSTRTQNLIVQMAIIEKLVYYKGGNGVIDHRFVVRAVSDSGKAKPVRVGGATTITKRFHLTDIENHTNVQMDQPHEQLSWGNRRKTKPVWKNPPPKFLKGNIALVVWLQDPITRKIVQASTHEFAWLTKRI